MVKVQIVPRLGAEAGDDLAPSRPDDPLFSMQGSQRFIQYCPIDSWKPTVNLYESDTSYYVCVDLAGMTREAIDVVVNGNVLVISGTREHPRPVWPVQDLSIHLMEIDQGPFCRSVEIPSEVDVDAIRASYTDTGYLWVDLPKRSGGPGA